MRLWFASLLVLPAALLVAGTASGRQSPNPKIVFNRDVRPILSDHCFACHGPDRAKRQANLRLDDRASSVARGIISPGKPKSSRLVERITNPDENMAMPPVAFHKKLNDAQKATLIRWISEGAEYQPHWSYIVPRRPSVPPVQKFKSLVANPIDSFILNQIERKRLQPSAEADRRTLIRRVFLDATGLPPSPAEVDRFLADKSPKAFEQVVDRLLASPAYGERMAVPWLDLVRYADTVGYHGDQNFNAWAYRDYVIDSFNRNKSFDRFTREQLAGDLLPDATTETRIATCYNRLNMMTREGGAQPKEYLAKAAADRVRTVGMAWMGSTLGCCECHNHKFDPFTAKDFYSMAAFFADVKQWGVYQDYDYTPNPELRGWTNDHPFPPEIAVESKYLKDRIEQQTRNIEKISSLAISRTDGSAYTGYQKWLSSTQDWLKQNPMGWAALDPVPLDTLPGTTRTVLPDRSIAIADTVPGEFSISVQANSPWLSALRIELLPSAQHGGSLFRSGGNPGNLVITASVAHQSAKPVNVPFRFAVADFHDPRYSNGFDINGIQSGWRLPAKRPKDPLISVWLPVKPVALNPTDVITIHVRGAKVGCLRISCSPISPYALNPLEFSPNQLYWIQHPEKPEIRAASYLMSTGWSDSYYAEARKAESAIFDCRGGLTPIMVAETAPPLTTRVLPRGNWQDESGEIVNPNPPGFLPGWKPATSPRATRLDLANWLVSPENPLTARVFVNRLWKQLFGAGLSESVEDVGAQGDWPSHPELLDWLAVEFRESGWNVKHMVKLMLMSHTYRQSSNPNPAARKVDPANRLLTSQNARRLDAEFVRDNALAISGLLVRDVGGPPCKPYQPPGYYVNLQFPDRDYVPDKDDRQWRRGLYTHWQRTFLQPMLANFDAPSREDCTATRTSANTPQQALTLLNDTTFVEAARALAARLPEKATDRVRINTLYQYALSRDAREPEKASLERFLGKVREEYKARPEDARKLIAVGYSPVSNGADLVEAAAWISVARVILNLHETITRY